MAQAKLSGILSSISGTIGNFNFRTTRNGVVIADRAPRNASPATSEQLLVRAYLSAAAKHWQTLSDAQRKGWRDYASKFFPFDKDGAGSGPAGQAVFLKAAWYLQAAGLAMPTNPPTAAPPATATGIATQTVTDQDDLVLRITHPITSIAGHRVLVEITPAILSAARRPQPSDFRAIQGLSAASIPALVASNQNLAFSGIRFPLEDGARFGARVTIVNPSGIPSQSFEAVLFQTF